VPLILQAPRGASAVLRSAAFPAAFSLPNGIGKADMSIQFNLTQVRA
jgi:hypothetical protein